MHFFLLVKKFLWLKEHQVYKEYTRYARNIVFWRAVLHFVMWCIWQERNARCFEVSERSILEIKSLLHSLLDWSTAFYSLPYSFLLDLIEFCNLRAWCIATQVHFWCTWVFSLFFFDQYIFIIKKKRKCKELSFYSTMIHEI